MELNVTIIEDNFVYRNLLQKEVENFLNKNHFFEINTTVVSNFSYYYDGLEDKAIQDHDIFFIDIDLNARYTGIDMGEKIRKLNTECYIVYVTSFETKTIEVVNKQILPWAYLVKQVDFNESHLDLYKILSKIVVDIKEKYTPANLVEVKIKNTTMRLVTSDILYIEGIKGSRNTVLLKTKNKEILISATLKKIKEILNFSYFYLDLRNYVINVNNVKSWNREYEIIEFINGEHLELGVSSIDKLKKFMWGKHVS